jgi:hypothetical protein
MAALYREVVLKEKPAVAENGFIPLGALTKPKGFRGTTKAKSSAGQDRGIPPLTKDVKDGAPHCVYDAGKIKSLGHPPKRREGRGTHCVGDATRSEAWATRRRRRSA